MIKAIKTITLILMPLIFLACNNSLKEQPTVSTSIDTARHGDVISQEPKAEVNTNNCDSLLTELIKSSNIDSFYKTLLFLPDGVHPNDSTFWIQIYSNNKANSHGVWGSIGIKKKDKLLYQSGPTEDSLILLKCDGELLNYYISHCIDWNEKW